MADPIRIYWDSCAWIGLINAEPDKVFPLRSIWEDAQRGKFEIWTSTYCYMELHYGLAPYGEPYPAEESDARFEDMLSQSFVNRVQLSIPIGRLARKMKRELHKDGLRKKADAVHLATALFTNCMELHTWDHADLLGFDNKVKCRDGSLLHIVKPGRDYLGAPLFEGLDPVSDVETSKESTALISSVETKTDTPASQLEDANNPTTDGIASNEEVEEQPSK